MTNKVTAMPHDSSQRTPLGNALNRLRRQVIDARDHPRPPAPTDIDVQAVFEAAEEARNAPSLGM